MRCPDLRILIVTFARSRSARVSRDARAVASSYAFRDGSTWVANFTRVSGIAYCQ
jgi:hypothetical protein